MKTRTDYLDFAFQTVVPGQEMSVQQIWKRLKSNSCHAQAREIQLALILCNDKITQILSEWGIHWEGCITVVYYVWHNLRLLGGCLCTAPCYAGQPAPTASWQMAKWGVFFWWYVFFVVLCHFLLVLFCGCLLFLAAAAALCCQSCVTGRLYFHSNLACWLMCLYTYHVGSRWESTHTLIDAKWRVTRKAGQRGARVKTD